MRRAGFDVRGMSNFFARLQRAVRLYENNASIYLRSHPLTGERLTDMQNREQSLPYRQMRDSVDFQFVRAKLRAMEGTPSEAVRDFEALLKTRNTLTRRRRAMVWPMLGTGDATGLWRSAMCWLRAK